MTYESVGALVICLALKQNIQGVLFGVALYVSRSLPLQHLLCSPLHLSFVMSPLLPGDSTTGFILKVLMKIRAYFEDLGQTNRPSQDRPVIWNVSFIFKNTKLQMPLIISWVWVEANTNECAFLKYWNWLGITILSGSKAVWILWTRACLPSGRCMIMWTAPNMLHRYQNWFPPPFPTTILGYNLLPSSVHLFLGGGANMCILEYKQRTHVKTQQAETYGQHLGITRRLYQLMA